MKPTDYDKRCEHGNTRRQGCSRCWRDGKCFNGDGNAICPPSLVVCRQCLDDIGETLQDLVKKE